MTTMRILSTRLAAAVLAGFIVVGCESREAVAPVAAASDAGAAIPSALVASADAWNNADLAGHIGLYTDDATFMGGNGPIQGRDVVGASLAKSFWRDGKPKQMLSFDRIEVWPLGDTHALSTGHFVLTGGGEKDRSGWFSLTWEKTATGWRIIHDHSS
jgi:uncharacterized protein (TIGR02246 family)